MRRLFFFIVLAVFIAALIVYGISHDTGYVRISYGHTLIESNVWVLAALNLIAITAIILAYSVIKNLEKGQAVLSVGRVFDQNEKPTRRRSKGYFLSWRAIGKSLKSC